MKSWTATGVPQWEAKNLIRHTPPESVPITFRLSSLGARFGAQMLDICITYGGVFLLLLLVAWLGIFSWNGLFTFYALISFFVRVPYYVLSEMVWNGRTLGKRILGIRVISLDGRRLTPHQIVARNLMKEVEVFLPISTLFSAADLGIVVGLTLGAWMLATVLVPVINKKNQRLGDMVAGTIVVDNPKLELLPDLAQTAAARGYEFQAEHLAIYGRYELQTLETILRIPPKTPEARKHVSEVAQTIRRRINYDEKLQEGHEWDFLMEFYRQQREFLESRTLFGDTRENKFHTSAIRPDQGLTRRFGFRPQQLAIYGRTELQALQDVLRTPPTSAIARKHVSDVAQTIRRKIGYEEPVEERDEWSFLTEFQRQQRDYLDNRPPSSDATGR
ncbi:hypothetical protein MASR1M32_23080 [Rhodobacter sp.]